jgi:hypothetical protein
VHEAKEKTKTKPTKSGPTLDHIMSQGATKGYYFVPSSDEDNNPGVFGDNNDDDMWRNL